MSIEIFVDSNFSGRGSGLIDFNSSFVGDFWNDKISSIKVHSGTWEFFEHSNFQGRSFQIGPGEYPSFNNDINDTISSFKKVAASPPPAPSNSDVLKRILDLTNIERSKVGLAPLKFNSQLAAAAQKHSRNMAMQDFFDHRNLQERVRAEGYPSTFVGENISAGNSTPEDAMLGWMNSPGHRDNILKAEYEELGVGHFLLENDQGNINFKHYWTQVFGRPR